MVLSGGLGCEGGALHHLFVDLCCLLGGRGEGGRRGELFGGKGVGRMGMFHTHTHGHHTHKTRELLNQITYTLSRPLGSTFLMRLKTGPKKRGGFTARILCARPG